MEQRYYLRRQQIATTETLKPSDLKQTHTECVDVQNVREG